MLIPNSLKWTHTKLAENDLGKNYTNLIFWILHFFPLFFGS
jgi:hypothetical protein